MKRFTYHHNKHDYELKIVNDVVVVFKDGKDTYQIEETNGCECIGYGYRKECTHYSRAKEFGLFILINKKREQENIGFTSEYIKESRNEAILKYATKHNLSKAYTKFLINNMADFVKRGKGLKELKNAFNKTKRRNRTHKSKT